jgi:flagellar biosynthesis/type III secretory pathway protein FliH
LFNQPHTSRKAVPWQPNSDASKKLSGRSYSVTNWTSQESSPFESSDYPVHASGFSAAHYQPINQKLSRQAKASLDLLEGEHRNENFGEEKKSSQASSETNEHLPFVMDEFGASRKSKLRVNVDPQVLRRALAQADLAENLVVSPITSDEKVAEPIVIHPDVPDESSMNTVSIDQFTGVEIFNLSEPTEVIVSDESDESEDSAAIVEFEKPNSELVEALAADTQEVARREAEHFAKGVEQGKLDAASELEMALEVARTEAFEQGKTEGIELAKQEAFEQGKVEGLKQGELNARQALELEMAAQKAIFETSANELSALINDPKKFFEPLKRLALHIAEQIVVGELKTSTAAIERLVQRCVDELDHPVHGAVVLEVNPEDKSRLQEHASELIKGMRVEAVSELKPGSVRVFANDSVVEDLVEHRLECLARTLLVDVESWQEKSAFAKGPILENEDAEDENVHS